MRKIKYFCENHQPNGIYLHSPEKLIKIVQKYLSFGERRWLSFAMELMRMRFDFRMTFQAIEQIECTNQSIHMQILIFDVVVFFAYIIYLVSLPHTIDTRCIWLSLLTYIDVSLCVFVSFGWHRIFLRIRFQSPIADLIRSTQIHDKYNRASVANSKQKQTFSRFIGKTINSIHVKGKNVTIWNLSWATYGFAYFTKITQWKFVYEVALTISEATFIGSLYFS